MTHFLTNLVSVIDTASNTLVDTITVRMCPLGVAITPDGTHVYVTSGISNTSGAVSVIKTATNAVIATVHLGFAVSPEGVAITSDGTRAYVVSFAPSSVSVIDTANNTVTAAIGVGPGPNWIAISPGVGPPTNKSQCKKGGWQVFTIPRKFKNQGDCVSFVNTGK